MTTLRDHPVDALERLFHEPSRLAILSALCAAEHGIAFTDLKVGCRLTDGNLNRHLKSLEEAGVVRIDKTFVDNKPRTTIHLTKTGLARFQDYLTALENVLRQAQKRVAASETRKPAPSGSLARQTAPA